MAFGAWYKLLEFDLSNRQTRDIVVPDDDYRKYLCGSGLAAKILYNELDPSLEPLDPRNPIIIMTGLLTGTPVPASSRHVICGRSPLTGIWNEAAVGGYWGAMLRRTGYDGLIIRNKSPEPVYLWITDESCKIKEASHLWGKDTYETNSILLEETNGRAKTACIGPAGERLILYASVTHEGIHSRMAGRGGMGALWGAKNLKAIVVYGKKRNECRYKETLLKEVKESIPPIAQAQSVMTSFGTSAAVIGAESFGDLPIKNWQLGSFQEGAQKITGQTVIPKYLDEHHSCHACPIKCSKLIKIEDGPYAGLRSHQPEYETLAGFGSNCLNDDWEVIAAANDKCNRYGMDTISTSAAVAFAMECYEYKIITENDTRGLSVQWGNPEAILGMIDLIVERKGIGQLLGKGTRNAAQELGDLALEFVIDAKGMELACHDPRAFTSMAVNYATATRGGCHLEGLTYFYGRGIQVPDLRYLSEPRYNHGHEGSAKICYDFQNYMSIFNAVGLCKFLVPAHIGPKIISRWINCVMGWDMDMDEVMFIGERIFNLKRMYNTNCGISRKDDVLSNRIMAEPRPDGKAKGVVPYLGKMLSEYYELRQWSALGIPKTDTVKKFGLDVM